ncbi:MAG: toll/interleukin-1 receptor domain-containing protein [Oscillospiraceae bacterium]|nr:toll/interleukin-1 receptor domain-containing protein [Oscillospiraceae bacterium]
MAIIKCKMCGGDLEILEDSSVCECEYCGTKQTVPKADDEKKIKLFERANRLRSACEFDKAAGVYETIISDFDQEAEAYWGLILCKFGIEYVDDPATGKKIPTCHRSSFESLMDDPNFEMVMECSDTVARRVYRDEAKQIEELRKRIIEVSSKEEPYDVFISYKELDENGERTLDSVIAQDIYTELTEKGYRVFFSRISLEDKLGVEYEPYIFAALNSAKVMLVVGTDYDYFNAVWVKNEWSRFLALIASGQKKTLIPVFKGIDAYDMPKEFNKLAAQDMGKVGSMQDLIRGVEKLLGKDKTAEKKETQPVIQQAISGGPNVEALLQRGRMALEDKYWNSAKGYFDRVLDSDTQNADAFLGLYMAETCISSFEELRDEIISKDEDPAVESRTFYRAKQFAAGQLSNDLTRIEEERIEAKRLREEERIMAKAAYEKEMRIKAEHDAILNEKGDLERELYFLSPFKPNRKKEIEKRLKEIDRILLIKQEEKVEE